MFLIFWRGEPIGWHKHAPKGCFLFFWRGGGLISHQVPKQFPSLTHQYPFVLIKFPKNSHQISLVPIKFLLFSSITHQYLFVLIKFPNNSHQIPLVPRKFPSISFCSYHVPIKILLFPWLWRIGRWAQRWMVRLVRDWGRVLNVGRTRERLGQSTKRGQDSWEIGAEY